MRKPASLDEISAFGGAVLATWTWEANRHERVTRKYAQDAHRAKPPAKSESLQRPVGIVQRYVPRDRIVPNRSCDECTR